MDLSKQFQNMRPYQDEEVPAAVGRLVADPMFDGVVRYLFQGADPEALKAKFRTLESIRQFQLLFSNPTVQTIVEKTSQGLSTNGAAHLDTSKAYLFVANHRDIVLDAAIMQYLLNQDGHRTSQITLAENLISGQMLLDLGKLNKMFTFYRGGNRKEQYQKALINSAYINHVIKEEKESIWIAQRNGRTKDGNDQTQPGLLNMFAMKSENIFESLEELNMVPVTISYEIEPCDILKVRELYISRRQTYEKAPNEDFGSILEGITGDKGRIRYHFGTPMNDQILELSKGELSGNEIYEMVAAGIDRQIHANYQLWPSNFVAFDLLKEGQSFEDRYTTEEKQSFEQRMEHKLDSLEGIDRNEAKELYLALYANPVINQGHT